MEGKKSSVSCETMSQLQQHHGTRIYLKFLIKGREAKTTQVFASARHAYFTFVWDAWSCQAPLKHQESFLIFTNSRSNVSQLQNSSPKLPRHWAPSNRKYQQAVVLESGGAFAWLSSTMVVNKMGKIRKRNCSNLILLLYFLCAIYTDGCMKHCFACSNSVSSL